MQMGTGHAPGHSDGADASSRGQVLSGCHVDGAQMAVHADEPAPVIDEHRVAGEKIIAGIDDGAGKRVGAR